MSNTPIFLCGFMGCGKSTVGKILSKKTGRNFIDLDTYIEEQEKLDIPKIFEQKGEEYFRKIESEALANFGGTCGVIATGGGALLTKENGNIAKNAGVVIFIDTPFSICYDRIKGDKNRPIAFSSTRKQLMERFEYRRPLYQKNSSIVVSGKGTPLEIVNHIIQNTKS